MEILDISVIIPCYNAADTLKRSLDSVSGQTCLPREIIVIDDGSDKTIEPIVAEWAVGVNIPIRLITQSNCGASAARNAGIRVAQSSYIAFLDADDIWFPEKLKTQYAFMVGEDLTICGHGYAYQASNLTVPYSADNTAHTRLKMIGKWRFLYGNPLFTPTVMVSKKDFSGFDHRFRRVDDYKAWIESFRSGKCGYFDTVLAAGFKNPIGQSGLTGSVDRMHESYVGVLKALLYERRISFIFYFVARLIEAFKLPIRKIRVKNMNTSK